jgi:Ca2+-binding EF-hand superfamily protein
MKIRHLLIAMAFACLVAGRVPAGDLPINVFKIETGDEEQVLLFLGPTRPLLIRLRLQVDGLGYRARWDEAVWGMSRVFDADGDGLLSRQEIARIDLARLNAPFPAAGMQAARGARSRDEAFEFGDLAAKVRLYAPAFAIEAEPRPQADPEGVDVFESLDRDKDGRLSRAEIASAATALDRLDVDDDEVISAAELGPYRNPFFANPAAVTVRAGPANMGINSSAFLLAAAGPAERARKILERYDTGTTRGAPVGSDAGLGTLILHALATPGPRARDGRLGRGEIGLDPEVFGRVDRDGDDALDLAEIERGLATVPDVEVIARIGRRDPWLGAIEAVGPPGPRPGGVSLRTLGPDGLLIDVGTAVIELRIGEDVREQSLTLTKSVYTTQFQNFDTNKDKALDRDEARTSPVLSRLFDAADRDRNGRLTEAELIAYFEFQAEVSGLRTVLRAVDQGSSLLDLLDADRDRRICLRELRALPEAIRREDRDGDGQVTPGEIVRHYRWTLGRPGGPGLLAAPAAGVVRTPGAGVPRAPRGAPTWFLKMDRNRDGDVSPREFLGPAAAFAAYDIDGDGLLSAAEAARGAGGR